MRKLVTLKLGILGAGSFIQRRILPLLKDIPSIRVTCLQKRNLEEAEAVAKAFDIPYAVSSREELLHHPEVEAIFIATANDCHEEDAIAAALAKKSVLCEKPLATSSNGIVRMQEAFKRNDVQLFVGQSLRFKPCIQKARQLVEEGVLGKLLTIRAYFTLPVPPDNWRHKKSRGGGVLQDIGVHLIDLIHYISGEEIVSVQAIAQHPSGPDRSEDTVLAIGCLTSGVYFSLECSLNQPLRSGFEVVGSKGRLISTDSLRQTEKPGERLQLIQIDDTIVDISLPMTNMYAEELAHFAKMLRGREVPLISANIGLRNQRVIEAIDRASNSLLSQQVYRC